MKPVLGLRFFQALLHPQPEVISPTTPFIIGIMEKKMETTIGVIQGHITLGLYRDNGKENGNYRVQGLNGYIVTLLSA